MKMCCMKIGSRTAWFAVIVLLLTSLSLSGRTSSSGCVTFDGHTKVQNRNVCEKTTSLVPRWSNVASQWLCFCLFLCLDSTFRGLRWGLQRSKICRGCPAVPYLPRYGPHPLFSLMNFTFRCQKNWFTYPCANL
jgi:hypothetical protein